MIKGVRGESRAPSASWKSGVERVMLDWSTFAAMSSSTRALSSVVLLLISESL